MTRLLLRATALFSIVFCSSWRRAWGFVHGGLRAGHTALRPCCRPAVSSARERASEGELSRQQVLQELSAACVATLALGVGVPAPASAKQPVPTKPLRDCLLNVERVRVSTQQLEDDLTNEGAGSNIKAVVKGLIRNYGLEDNLRQGSLYIESSGDRDEAERRGKEAVEYLAQVLEYFPEVVDNTTGLTRNVMTAETRDFTIRSLAASRENLEGFLARVPPGALAEVRDQLRSE